MEIDFHYYATYLAAGLAGYDTVPPNETTLSDAAKIAYAAQYVDDLDESRVLENDAFIIQSRDFTPVATVQTSKQIAALEVGIGEWAPEKLQKLRQVWSAFHFLPGNYGDNPERLPYGNPAVLRSNKENYAQIGAEFQLMCRPNSILVGQMINNLAQHANEDYFLHLLGLRMHVMADTWAHMNYAGTPSYYINDAQKFVWDNTSKKEIPFAPFSSTPSSLTPRSVAYLGHGRMGHLPDCPWLVYTYQPLWSDVPITKNNPQDYLKAFRQMVAAMSWLRMGQYDRPFDPSDVADLPADIEAALMALLTQPYLINGNDMAARKQAWAQAIPTFQYNDVNLSAAPNYLPQRWLDIYKQTGASSSDHYCFSKAAALHLALVTAEVRQATGMVLSQSPSVSLPPPTLQWGASSTLQSVQLLTNEQADPPRGIGAFTASGIAGQYYPKLSSNLQPLSLILPPGVASVRTGDLVQILSQELGLGYYRVLGDWKTGTYYYTQSVDWAPQTWVIKSANQTIADGQPIQPGEPVQLVNLATQKYLCWDKNNNNITTAGNSMQSVWIIQ